MPPKPAIPPLLKDLNERTVLDTIRAGAPISRAEISRRAGISKPTVSLALQSLLEAGIVREAAHDPDGPSYGAVFFEPVAEAALVLGFDLGARFLRGAVCDLAGAVRARQDVELPSPGAEAALEAIGALRSSLVDAAGLDDELLDGVVVGVPGVVATTGRIELATNVPGLEETDVAGELAARLGLPVTLENDINLAALGEQWSGVARGVDDFVFISIGTGLGAGLVLRGELHRGHNGAAGELDYALGSLGSELDPCAGAVVALAEELAGDGSRTALAAPYDARKLFAAAREGDELAQAVVSESARRIAMHVAPIAGVADVDLVVLGGGIGSNGDLLLEPVRALLRDWLPYPPRVEVSSLGDGAVLDRGVVGGAPGRARSCLREPAHGAPSCAESVTIRPHPGSQALLGAHPGSGGTAGRRLWRSPASSAVCSCSGARRRRRTTVLVASPTRTPGVVNPEVRQETIGDTICLARLDAHRPAADELHRGAEDPADARVRGRRRSVRLPGGPSDQPRARRPPDRPAQPVAGAAAPRRGGRPGRERAERQGLLRRAHAGRGAAP